MYQLVYERISWFTSASAGIPAGHQLVVHWSTYPAFKIHSYKHLNLLVILLFTCKVASGSPSLCECLIIFSFAESVIKQGCGAGCYVELHVRSTHQHEQAYLLYGCAYIHRQIYPCLVHVSSPCSFLNIIFIIYLFIHIINDIILTTFRIILSTWLYNYLAFKSV